MDVVRPVVEAELEHFEITKQVFGPPQPERLFAANEWEVAPMEPFEIDSSDGDQAGA